MARGKKNNNIQEQSAQVRGHSSHFRLNPYEWLTEKVHPQSSTWESRVAPSRHAFGISCLRLDRRGGATCGIHSGHLAPLICRMTWRGAHHATFPRPNAVTVLRRYQSVAVRNRNGLLQSRARCTPKRIYTRPSRGPCYGDPRPSRKRGQWLLLLCHVNEPYHWESLFLKIIFKGLDYFIDWPNIWFVIE